MKKKSVIAVALALVMSLTCLVGCGASTPTASGTDLAEGGILRLSVNPEIAVHYNAEGNVTKVAARNDDGSAILEDYSGYEGKATRLVVAELVTAIGEAGYFVEEIEGEARQITIEIEAGSVLPSENFLNEVAEEARECVNSNEWTAPVDASIEDDLDDDDDDGICTNPNCDDDDCDDIDYDEDDRDDEDNDDDDVRTCTNPNCDDDDCDDIDCDDDDRDDEDDDVRTCSNPHCDDDDCDDIDCDDDDRDDDDDNDVRTCTNPYCDDDDCDDTDCDDDDRDDDDDDNDVRTCTNPNCDDDDCDDTDCDEDDRGDD